MKVHLKSGETISINKREKELLVDFLMKKDYKDTFIRINVKRWFWRRELLLQGSDISAVD